MVEKSGADISRRVAIAGAASALLTPLLNDSVQAQTQQKSLERLGIKILDYGTVEGKKRLAYTLSLIKDGKAILLDVRDPKEGEFETRDEKGRPWGLTCNGVLCPATSVVNIIAHAPEEDFVFSDEEVVGGALRALPDKKATVLVVCSAGIRSAWAARKLASLGYKNVVMLKGGISNIPDGASVRSGTIPDNFKPKKAP